MFEQVLNLESIAARDVTTLVARGVLAAGRLTPRGAVVYELTPHLGVDAFEAFAEHADDLTELEEAFATARACDDGECASACDLRSAKELSAETMSNARQALYRLAKAVEGLKSATARRQLAAAMTELEGALES